jgi:hypothetical protein
MVRARKWVSFVSVVVLLLVAGFIAIAGLASPMATGWGIISSGVLLLGCLFLGSLAVKRMATSAGGHNQKGKRGVLHASGHALSSVNNRA